MAYKKNPLVVATGITSAFLSDERLLREFIVGNAKVQQLNQQGHNAVLFLINDSFDALSERQLRIAVNKDEALYQAFLPYCGQPIAEVPDPYGCHESLSEHFVEAWQKRLDKFSIRPVVLDTYRTYEQGYYQPFIKYTFKHYERIQSALKQRFASYSMRNLFRAQCPDCKCVDKTDIKRVTYPLVQFTCERCGGEFEQSIESIRGKLSWKLDCAARWNLYSIDYEAFSKAHVSELGSFEVSKFVSEEFFGNTVPSPLRYGEVKVARALSYRLLDILPPELLTKFLSEHIEKDMEVTKESVEHFCRRYEIAPGLSYVDFVKQDLAISAIAHNTKNINTNPQNPDEIDRSLVDYGNQFSKVFYQKQHGFSLSGVKEIQNVDKEVAKVAMDILLYATHIRQHRELAPAEQHEQILNFTQQYQRVRGVLPYLRRVFDQQGGPGIPTLLMNLPADYLNLVYMAIGFYVEQKQASPVWDLSQQEQVN